MTVPEGLTLLVSLLVLIVSYSQWRTANQRVVVDLYDRRLAVYQRLEAAISEVMRHGAANDQSFHEFAVGQADARFLFGDDVKEYLQQLRKGFAFLVSFRDADIDESPNRTELIDIKYKHITKITGFFAEAPDIFEPYMRLSQRHTPFWRPW